MAELNITIPSYKRWEDLPGYDYFKTAKYIVPESQYKNYIEGRNKNRFIAIPDSEDGNIVKKRNWILKNIPRPLILMTMLINSLCVRAGNISRNMDELNR